MQIAQHCPILMPHLPTLVFGYFLMANTLSSPYACFFCRSSIDFDCGPAGSLRGSHRSELREDLRQEDRADVVADQNRASFLEMFRVPPGSRTDYQAGIPQALMLINGDLISKSTIESGKLLQSLQAPFFSDEQRIENLFLATLSRKPTPHEAEQVRSYLDSSGDGSGNSSTMEQRLSDVLWTLLNSAEFTLNH